MPAEEGGGGKPPLEIVRSCCHYLACQQGAADLLATPLFRRPLDDDPILRYFDTSILQCFDASCRLLRLDASLLRCFEASMPRCSIRESAREKERAREQARPRIPGPRIPGPRATGRQAENREQRTENRQAENRQAENRELRVLLLARSILGSQSPCTPQTPQSRQAASYLFSHTPVAPDKQGSADIVI